MSGWLRAPWIVLVLAGALAACSLDPASRDEPGGGQGDRDTRPLELLYARTGGLFVRPLAGDGAEALSTLPPGDLFAAQGSRWLAEVVPTRPSDDEDFLAAPRLLVAKLGTVSRRLTVGPGTSPLWDSSGRWVAYLRPVGARRCAGEACQGRARVVAFNPVTEESRRLLPGGHYALLAFAHGKLWVADRTDLSLTFVVSRRGRRGSIPVPPASFWDVSPDGRWLIRSSGRRARLVPLRGMDLDGHGRRVPLSGRLLADGSWAHDSSHVAAVLLPSSGGGQKARVALFSPSDRTPVFHRGTGHAVGQVLWAPDDSGFTVVRAAGRHLGRLEAAYCRLEGGCRSLFSWIEGVLLLRVQRAISPSGG